MLPKNFIGDLSFKGGTRFLIILFLIFNNSISGIQLASTDQIRSKEGGDSKPKPKNITQIICEISDGKIISERKLSSADLNESEIEANTYDQEGIIAENDLSVKFNTAGQKTGNKNINFKSGIEKNILYFYNDSVLTSTVHLNKFGDTVAVWFYKYDERGNLIEECERKSMRFERAKWVYTYDEKSNLLEAQFYRNGKYVKSNIYTYENYICECCEEHENICECRRIEKVITHIDGKVKKRSILKYNCKGNIVEEIIYNKKGENSLNIKSKYNQYGYKSEKYYDRKDRNDYLIRYEYEYFN